jgi:hypothetical protein
MRDSPRIDETGIKMRRGRKRLIARNEILLDEERWNRMRLKRRERKACRDGAGFQRFPDAGLALNESRRRSNVEEDLEFHLFHRFVPNQRTA